MTFKIVVETITPDKFDELKQENLNLKNDLKKLQGQYASLYETLYCFMDRFAELKRSLKDRVVD